MTDAQTFSWMLLSVSENGSTRKQISEMADAINHAVPTHKELETSLGWLRQNDLVQEEGGRFKLTSAGSALLTRLRSPTRPIMQTWHELEQELEGMLQ